MKPSFNNIFLADDDCDDVEFFQYVLEKICPGCNLRVFANGQDLVEKLHNANTIPDIVFLDVNMPVMNGLEALEIIKKLPAFVSVPVIVYSTSANGNDVGKAMQLGAGSYVVKPSDLHGLEKVVARILYTNWKDSLIPLEVEEFLVRVS